MRLSHAISAAKGLAGCAGWGVGAGFAGWGVGAGVTGFGCGRTVPDI